MTIQAETSTQSWGAARCAQRLSERVGAEVAYDDIQTLAAAGHLAASDSYKGWPLYPLDQVDALPVDVVTRVVEDRINWTHASVAVETAAKRLDIPAIALLRAAETAGMDWAERPGQRVPASLPDLILDLTEPATPQDADDAAKIRAALQIGPARAAAWLGLRRTDFDHLVRAELIEQVGTAEIEISRRRTSTVPLYAVEDLDRALDDPRVPWPKLREVAPGDKSPLLALLKARVPNRPAALRGWIRAAEDAFGVGFLAAWDRWSQSWGIGWDTYSGTAPTVAHVKNHLELDVRAAAAGLTPAAVTFQDPQLETVWWAKHKMTPGAAIILDTETTGLYQPDVVEVAVVDAATGRVRFHSLVRPILDIDPEAAAVHGHSASSLAEAPEWEDVLPRLRRAVGDRTVLAWNAGFDLNAVAATTRRRAPRVRHTGHLANPRTWECLMEASMDWTGSWRLIPLAGPHDAVGDCHAARRWLIDIANNGQKNPDTDS